jgi:hypothetical protein
MQSAKHHELPLVHRPRWYLGGQFEEFDRPKDQSPNAFSLGAMFAWRDR